MIVDDNTPMPFGKHKGTKISELPLSYVLWLHSQPWPQTHEWTSLAVRRYIRDNIDVFRKEEQQARL